MLCSTPGIAAQESAVIVGHWLSVLFKGLCYLRCILALCEEIQWNCDIHFFLYKILSKASMCKLLVFSKCHEKKDSVKIETTVPLSSCRVMQEGRKMDNIFPQSWARTIWSPSVHCSLRQVSISQVPRSTCPAAAAAGPAVPAHVQLPAGRALRGLLFPLSSTSMTAEQPVTGSTVQH